MARRLRIAAAVFFALLAVAFVALWVRSHYQFNSIHGPLGDNHELTFMSYRGVVVFVIAQVEFNPFRALGFESEPIPSDKDKGPLVDERFQILREPEYCSLLLPHWFLGAIAASLAALFVFKRTWRFTTRGLLIATTVVAAIFGLAVYAI